MQKLHTQSEAFTLLEPYIGDIKMIMNESLADINRAMGTLPFSANTRARTSLLHSVAVERSIRHFADKPGIVLVKKYQTIQIVFNRQLIGRIKQVNKDNKSRNARTGRNDLILSQYNGLFEGMELPKRTNIEFGYMVDSIWSKFERLVIVCRVKDTIEWWIPISAVNEDIVPMSKGSEITFTEETQIKLKEAR
jgi:hypothetical protein